jgi:hypothetical protein
MFQKRFHLPVVAVFAFVCLSGCGGSSKPVSVAVTATATTVDGADTVSLTAAVTNDKNSDGVTWTVSGAGALSGATTASATYTAPAATSSAQTATITATSVADTAKTGSVTLTVPAAPSITTTSTNLAGAVGTAYSVTLAGAGGITPYTWSATGLPACLTMTTAGVLSGTVTASCAGSYTPTFNLTDSGTWATSNFASSYFMYKIESGDYNNDSQTGVLTLDSSGDFSNFATDNGGQSRADWVEGLSNGNGTTETGAVALDTITNGITMDSAYGLIDVNFMSGTTTTTESYCFAISVDEATTSSAKGKLVCLDASSNSPRLNVLQE